MSVITATELNEWLMWAGARLLAMPTSRIKPAQPHVVWPEFSQDQSEILSFRGKLPLRAMAPAAEEITIMDLILTLPNICQRPMTRRVLNARSLVHPINSRHLFSWRKIALMIHLNSQTAKAIHTKGLEEVMRKADPKIIARLKA